jgi:hypothetical protein
LSGDDATFESLLRGRQAQLLTAWRELVLASFPEQTAQFLRRERDPFRNPLGDRIREGTATVLEGLVQGRRLREFESGLDLLVRVRAVQGQPPSEALAWMVLLKRACRETLGDALDGARRAALDERIDALTLCAFDAYARCREEIHQIQLRDVRRRVATVFERFSAGGPHPSESGARPADRRCEP